MEERVTLIKPYRQKETLRLATLKELADIIGSERYAEEVAMVRYLTPLVNIRLQRDGQAKGVGNVQDKLPRICFALQKENRKGQSVTLSYTRLVLIEVDHLTGIEEAEAVRQGAAEIPHTLMAFVGADGRSVKIVCRGASFDADGQTADEQLFHENLYERARLIYNGQLGVTVDKLDPLPERICYMSHDQGVYLNSDATPVYAKSEKPTALSLGRAQQRSTGDDYDQYLSLHNAYEFCLTRAYDECEHIVDDSLRKHSVLTLLAKYAMQSGIPLGMAQHLTLLARGLLCSDRASHHPVHARARAGGEVHEAEGPRAHTGPVARGPADHEDQPLSDAELRPAEERDARCGRIPPQDGHRILV